MNSAETIFTTFNFILMLHALRGMFTTLKPALNDDPHRYAYYIALTTICLIIFACITAIGIEFIK